MTHCLTMRRLALRHRCQEAIAIARDRLDVALLVPIVSEGPTRVDHALHEGPVLHELPRPQVLDQLILGDRMVAVLYQIRQDFEGEGLERDGLPGAAEFVAPRVKLIGIKS